MKWIPSHYVSSLVFILSATCLIAQRTHESVPGCNREVFVEGPTADLFVSAQDDTLNWSHEPVMQMRGEPAGKRTIPFLGYELSHLDPQYVDRAILKIYTVSRRKPCDITLYGTDLHVEEDSVDWLDFTRDGTALGSAHLTEQPYLEYEVTDFVRERMQSGRINFYFRTNSRRTIEIASRESGLSPELIVELCVEAKKPYGEGEKTSQEEATMQILPHVQPGKFTVELSGVPPGSFADLMIMDEHGNILRKLPLAIRSGQRLYHALDIGPLIPGQYWALFREGRVMIRKAFRLKPTAHHNSLLQVDMISGQ